MSSSARVINVNIACLSVEATDAINYTSGRAVEEAEKAIAALGVLPESDYKNALADLARFSVDRNY